MEAFGYNSFVWVSQNAVSSGSCFGQIIYRPGGDCGPRIQRDYELVVIHSGGAQVTVDGVSRVLPLGTPVLFLPGHNEHFQFSANLKTHHSWCSISPVAMPPKMARELGKAPFTVQCSEVFTQLFSAGLMLPTARNFVAERGIIQLGIALFAEFLHLANLEGIESCQPEPLTKALHYIEKHFGEAGCLSGAIRAAGVSRNVLLRHFTEKLNLPPSRYVWRFRAERGIAMLSKTGLTISEIAYQCGFKTPFHFSRMVKHYQGLSPLKLRKQAWKQ